MNKVTALLLTAVLALAGLSVRADNQPATTESPEILQEAKVTDGLVIHLGCGDGVLTAELAGNDRIIVQGLEEDVAAVEKARQRLSACGVYGRVSVEQSNLVKLPYANHLADLVIVDDLPRLLAAGLTVDEVLRVTAPGHIAAFGSSTGGLAENHLRALMLSAGIKEFTIIKKSGMWAFVCKPRPADMDEWTHRFHDPSMTLVSQDSAFGPIENLRWQGGPRFNGTGAFGCYADCCVSAGGRSFFVLPKHDVLPPLRNETPPVLTFTALSDGVLTQPCPRCLVARDAWNGLPLWVCDYGTEDINAVGSPMFCDLNCLLVATEKLVFTQLKGRVVALDAATGKLVKDYCPAPELKRRIVVQDNASAPELPFIKILYCQNRLVVAGEKIVSVFDVGSGKELWTFHPVNCTAAILGGNRVFILDNKKDIIVFDLEAGGTPAWQQDASQWNNGPAKRLFFKNNLLVVITEKKPGIRCLVNLSGGGGEIVLNALKGDDGKLRWQYLAAALRSGRHNILYADGLVWVSEMAGDAGKGRPSWTGLDPDSGTVKKQLTTPGSQATGATCSAFDIATERFFLNARPVGFQSWEDGKIILFCEQRTTCRTEDMIANGLLYVNPNICLCVTPCIRGFDAYGPGNINEPQPELVESPARHPISATVVPAPFATSALDWPMFRGDPRRSGSMAAAFSGNCTRSWETRLNDAKPPHALLISEWNGRMSQGDLMTSPVVAGGLVFVGICETHAVVACDATTGKPVWRFNTGGRLDTPPTICDNMCLVGCYDGWVYGLSAADGALVPQPY